MKTYAPAKGFNLLLACSTFTPPIGPSIRSFVRPSVHTQHDQLVAINNATIQRLLLSVCLPHSLPFPPFGPSFLAICSKSKFSNKCNATARAINSAQLPHSTESAKATLLQNPPQNCSITKRSHEPIQVREPRRREGRNNWRKKVIANVERLGLEHFLIAGSLGQLYTIRLGQISDKLIV